MSSAEALCSLAKVNALLVDAKRSNLTSGSTFILRGAIRYKPSVEDINLLSSNPETIPPISLCDIFVTSYFDPILANCACGLIVTIEDGDSTGRAFADDAYGLVFIDCEDPEFNTLWFMLEMLVFIMILSLLPGNKMVY